MTVRSEGDTWVKQQLAEKEVFEAELRRLGFLHEDFILSVRRAPPGAAGAWACHYAVRVTNSRSGRSNFYWVGHGDDWVAQFVRDLAEGFFGRSAMPNNLVSVQAGSTEKRPG